MQRPVQPTGIDSPIAGSITPYGVRAGGERSLAAIAWDRALQTMATGMSGAPGMRIHSLDLLRGLALLGMFVVHFHANSFEPGGFEDVIRTLVWRLVESKSHGTFAFLFGAGFGIQLRQRGRSERFVPQYLRRLAVLACFGFAAHAFFGYNVLLGYACWGLALLGLGRWPTWALVAVAVCSAMSVPLYFAAGGSGDPVTAAQVNHALRAAEAQDSYLVLLDARLHHMAWFYTQPFFFLPGSTLTLFIIGVLFVRHRVFEDVNRHRLLLTSLAGFGGAAWLADNWLLPATGIETTFGLVRDQWLTFTYVAVLLILLDGVRGMRLPLRPVASAGRMALTNYLLQIALLDVLFSGYAIGLGTVRPVAGLVAALAGFAAEAAFSSLWLARFPHGPAEWLWRRLTYGAVPQRQQAEAERIV